MNINVHGYWLANKNDKNKKYTGMFFQTNISYDLVTIDEFFDNNNIYSQFIDKNCETDEELNGFIEHLTKTESKYFYVFGYQKDLLSDSKLARKLKVDEIGLLMFVNPKCYTQVIPKTINTNIINNKNEITKSIKTMCNDIIISYSQFGHYGLTIKSNSIPSSFKNFSFRNCIIFNDKCIEFENDN